MWGGLASVALDVVVAQSLLAGDVPQIVADARAIGALAGGVAGAAATHGVENDAVRDMAEGVAEGMATSLRCLVPGKVQLGPASGAQTGPMWVESAIGGGDAEGSAVAVAGAVIVPVTFECASSLAHRDVWVKVVMGALVALVICLAAVATHRGALPKVVSSVRRIVRVAGYLDAQGMVVLPGTPLQSAAPPRTLQDAAARLTSAIQLLVKTVFRSGTVMRRVLDNAREVNLPGDAGLLEMYGIEELSPAAPLPDVTRNRGSLHTVEDDFTFGDLVSKPLLAAPQGRSTDQSAKEGGVAFRGKATSMPQGPDAAGPQRRSGTRVRMSLGSLLSSRAKRGVSVDVRESAADSGKTQPSRIADEVVEKT